MLWTILFAGLAWAGTCRHAVGAEELDARIEDALHHLQPKDDGGFHAAVDAAQATIPCLDEVLPPPSAAAYHRLLGIRWLLDGDAMAATDAFRAAIGIAPGDALAAELAPPGSALRRAWDTALALPVSEHETVALDDSFVVYVDGTPTRERPTDVPTLVQLERAGELTWTGYVPAGEILPTQLLTTLARDDRSKAASERGRDLSRAKPPLPPREPGAHAGQTSLLWALAGGSAAAAGGLFATSAITRRRFDEAPTKGRMTLTNGAWFGSIGFGVAAVGLGSAALWGGAR